MEVKYKRETRKLFTIHTEDTSLYPVPAGRVWHLLKLWSDSGIYITPIASPRFTIRGLITHYDAVGVYTGSSQEYMQDLDIWLTEGDSFNTVNTFPTDVLLEEYLGD